jgi:hypothetical protein
VTTSERGTAVTRCPFCDGTPDGETIAAREIMFATAERFDYRRCATCASLWLERPPIDLSPYYPSSYYSVTPDPEQVLSAPVPREAVRVLGRSALTGRTVLADAARLAPKREVGTLVSIYRAMRAAGLVRGTETRVLDVGAGSGLLVHAVALAGFRHVLGLDPHAPGDRTFTSGARLLARDIAALDEGPWDLVMMHHTLEHAREPAALLHQCQQLLSPEGRILVRVPVCDSRAYRHYGVDWTGMDPPRHLAIPTRAALHTLAARTSLRVRLMDDDSSGSQFWASEQARLGIPLNDPRSVAVSARRSLFSARTRIGWSREAARLNRIGDGDQVACVLVRAT